MLQTYFTAPSDIVLLKVFAIVLLTAVAYTICHFCLGFLEKKADETQNVWDDVFVMSIRRPLKLAILVLGFAMSNLVLRKVLDPEIHEFLLSTAKVSFIGIFAWFGMSITKETESRFKDICSEDNELADLTTITAIANIAKIAVILVAILGGLQTFGFSVSGLLALGGVGGLALGFAAKDMLANLFGSLIIFLDRPFKIGEWIRSTDKQIEGVVENIGWRMTVLRTFSKNPIYVPNSVFATMAIENPSRMTNRRIHETIGIRYDDFHLIEEITSAIKTMLLNHPEIDTELTLMVNFTTFNQSSLDIFIYTFTKTIEWEKYHEVKQDILIKAGKIITELGAEIAYPTSKVKVEMDA